MHGFVKPAFPDMSAFERWVSVSGLIYNRESFPACIVPAQGISCRNKSTLYHMWVIFRTTVTVTMTVVLSRGHLQGQRVPMERRSERIEFPGIYILNDRNPAELLQHAVSW